MIELTTKSLADLAEGIPHQPGSLVVFTAGASPEHAARIAALGGRLIIDHGTMRRRMAAKDGNATSPQRIEDAMGAERVRCVRNHIKAAVAIGLDGEPVGVIGSPNLNRITRPEQIETLAPVAASRLLDVAQRVFDNAPPGIVGVSGGAANQALASALAALRGTPVAKGRAFAQKHIGSDDLVVVDRLGMGDAVLAAIKAVGPGARVDAVTWSVGEDISKALGRRIRDGATVSLCLPARFARRKPERAADVFDAGVNVRWSPAHAKVAVIRGAGGVITLSGGCNFTNAGQLDAIVVRHGEAAAAEAMALLESLPAEPAPDGWRHSASVSAEPTVSAAAPAKPAEVTSQPDFFGLLVA